MPAYEATTLHPPMALYAAPLARIHGLVHGFSTRLGGFSTCYGRQGDLNLGFTPDDDPANVRINRQRFLTSIEAHGFQYFGLLRQQHTPIVHTLRTLDEASASFTQPALRAGDGLITQLPNLLLTVQAADCIPVLVCDPTHHAIGAFHAGWRGTAVRIVEAGIAAMQSAYGTDPADLIAAIGPGIGPGSYQVGAEVHTAFTAAFPYAEDLFTTVSNQLDHQLEPNATEPAPTTGEPIQPELYLDLWEANRRQLLQAGVPTRNITVLGEDTAAHTDRFFSHRAEHGKTGRMMAAIGLRA